MNTRFAWICILLLANAAFGLAHSDQGVTGMIEEGIAGLILGAMYLRNGKNLAVPILAQGASDTLDMLLLFVGEYSRCIMTGQQAHHDKSLSQRTFWSDEFRKVEGELSLPLLAALL